MYRGCFDCFSDVQNELAICNAMQTIKIPIPKIIITTTTTKTKKHEMTDFFSYRVCVVVVFGLNFSVTIVD